MDFWTTSDGKDASQTTGEFDGGGGKFEPIPSGTQLKACIEEAKWDNFGSEYFISLKWTVLEGEFKARKIFQKLKVEDEDHKKADKAKRMLGAIAKNAGGGLLSLGRKPTDQDMSSHLTMKPMAIVVQIWETKNQHGEDISGNWISAVASVNKAQTSQQPTQQQAASSIHDDIPF